MLLNKIIFITLISFPLFACTFKIDDKSIRVYKDNNVTDNENNYTRDDEDKGIILFSPNLMYPIPTKGERSSPFSGIGDEIHNVCPKYKRGAVLDLDKMVDVWKVVYYNLPTDISCFKIYIKNNSIEEKNHHKEIYGNITDNVDWNICNLEIRSGDKTVASGRKHFLQGTIENKGIMDNVVIEEEMDSNGITTYCRHNESADQWLVIKNILLMRDCDTGDIVVFSRVPYKPSKEDIMDALMVFGEASVYGKMHCNDELK